MNEPNSTTKRASKIAFTIISTSILLSTFLVQPAKADNAIYILADGSVDPLTAPIKLSGDIYTLEDNINSPIEVQRSNVTINGNGHTLHGNGTGTAINFFKLDRITVKNVKITNYSTGIRAGYSTNTVITNNIVANCTYAVLPEFSPNTTIINNTIENNKWDGIFAVSSPNSVIINNTVVNQGKWGIYVGYSKGTLLQRNLMNGNRFNFGVSSDFAIDADTSNTVDGKPIYFWIKQRDRQVPLDAGFVAIVNSKNITVQNLDLHRNGHGVVLANSENCIVENLNVTANAYFGIYLVNSSRNTIRNNGISDNDWGGIALVASSDNTVSNNTIEDLDKSILIQESNRNTINKNIMRNNDEGPYLFGSSDNIVINNTIENNDVGIYLYESSNNNVIHHNNFANNAQQVYIEDSTSTWDNGYPSGGNYWNDYTGIDANGDDMGDSPYIINYANRDNYPHINPIQQSSTSQSDLNLTADILKMASIVGVGFLAYVLIKMKSKHLAPATTHDRQTASNPA